MTAPVRFRGPAVRVAPEKATAGDLADPQVHLPTPDGSRVAES
jgi:hypothetical protein